MWRQNHYEKRNTPSRTHSSLQTTNATFGAQRTSSPMYVSKKLSVKEGNAQQQDVLKENQLLFILCALLEQETDLDQCWSSYRFKLY